MHDFSRQQRQSWNANAQAWASAVRDRRIESRRLATDAAMLDAVLAVSPRRVLDLGCGEGWLCRALSRRGVDVLGVDAAAELVALARDAGNGHFLQVDFTELATGAAVIDGSFDVVACNFSLLDEELLPLLSRTGTWLEPSGVLLIQTLHPQAIEVRGSGWCTENFAGLGEGFVEPMPWYYRSTQNWLNLLVSAGYAATVLREPTHPVTGCPLSLLLAGRLP